MSKATLQENVDFVWENGNVVFTSDFLLRRGFCCNSRCRNCPYKTKNEKMSDVKCFSDRDTM